MTHISQTRSPGAFSCCVSELLGESGAREADKSLGQFVRVASEENDGASLEVDTAGAGSDFAAAEAARPFAATALGTNPVG